MSPVPSHCPACGGSRMVSLHHRHHWDEDGHFYALAECGECRYRGTHPMPEPEVLDRLYAERFDYDWYRAHRAGIYADAKRRLLEVAPWLGRSVLDYGGGNGYLARAASRLGYDSAVYDPYCGNADDGPLSRRWDTVFCLHVLEHSTDPAALLDHIGTLLPSGGSLILAVPNAAGAGYARLGTNWHWFQGPLIHVSHFTPTALCRLLHRRGFQLEGLSFHERWNANSAADLDAVAETRRLEREWQDNRDPTIAWRNIRYRYRQLHSVRDQRQDNEALAEILVIARKP